MRTKSLILTAVVGVAATVSAMAQNNVYSVNAVGYVNKTMVPGFNLIGNPLNTGSNTVSQLFPSVPLGSRIFRYVNGSFPFTTFVEDDETQVQGWDQPNLQLNPGQGFFFQNNRTTNVTVTFVGEVPQGTLANPVVTGFNLKSTVVPQAGQLDTVHQYPAALGDRVYKYNSATRGYAFTTFVTDDDTGLNGWQNPALATVDVAEGVFIFTQAGKAWNRTFSATN
jgi:hypothetical protein